MRRRFFIDTHKGVTFLVILGMMTLFSQWQNATAWVYLALHGTYGILWVLKSRNFPDKKWEQPVSFWRGVGYYWGGMTLYWIAPYLLNSRGVQAPPWLLGMAISLYTFGIFLHYAADMQKYTALRYNPDHLITEGLLSHTRNINYFGELLIYLGFGLLALHWLPVAILLLWVIAIWWPNMRRKDRSLARYPDFAAYRARTKLFIPYVI
jgi:protein-S-isoprenylcysteine O-methyltransferase Ste14